MDAAPLQLTGLISHGMDTHAVAADWPALTIAEVRAVLQHYPQTGTVEHLVWHSPRPFSAACVAHTSVGNIFIKRHHHVVRTAHQLFEEHAFIAHLHANGAQVTMPLVANNGASAIDQGTWCYEVYWRASGCDIYRDAMSWSPFQSTQHAREAGAALAHMHIAARHYTAPVRKTHTLVSGFSIFGGSDPIAAMQTWIDTHPAIAAYLSERDWQAEVNTALMPFHAALQPHTSALTPLWTHNDWHASNLLWSDNTRTAAVATVLDFGLCNRTSALFDLATAIERNVIAWLDILNDKPDMVRFDLLDSLLAGYTSVLPLTAQHYLALAALLPLVHTDFALSELDYFNGITRSTKNASLAYDGYFIAHGIWFQKAQGQALLAHIAART
jgi:Ser/Thr protein kinase RdoA (MazF antagonist)